MNRIKQRINLIASIILFFSTIVIGQNDIAIGKWRTHFPFSSVISVTQSETKVYFAAEQMIAIFDKNDGSVEQLDKNNGLTQVDIELIRYYPEKELLLVGYFDGNIDIITEDAIINIADVKRYNLVAEKFINHIHFNGDFAYLSYSFGLVQLDVTRYEVKNTFFTDNLDVNASYILDDKIYMATEDGIYEGNQSLNLNDFTNWELHGTNKNLPTSYNSAVMEYFNGMLYADVNDTLKRYNGTTWENFQNTSTSGDSNPIRQVFYNDANVNRHLETTWEGDALMLTTNLIACLIQPNGDFFPFRQTDFLASPMQTIVYNGRWYWADLFKGAWRFNRFEWDFTPIRPNSPNSTDAHSLTIADDELWVSTGGVNGAWNALNRKLGLYQFNEGFWTAHNRFTNEGFQTAADIMATAVHPTNGKIYAGSYRAGLFEYDGENVRRFDDDNTEYLLSPPLDCFTVRITGLAFDQEENLWISNYESPRPIVVLKNDGTWENYAIPEQFSTLGKMVVDRNGYKWALVVRGSGGVVVFNENAEGSSSNFYRVLTTGNSELPSNEVNSIAVDRDGDVWIGTAEGTVVFECSSQLFSADGCIGRKVIVEEDDFGEYLLKTEDVTAIAVDGADRKWFGTGNGIFVQSANGEETVLRFTEDNSPLPSDQIIDIAVNQNTGEVFVATEKGMVSYRGEATLGGDTHADSVLVFPNPVRPEYTGEIAIRGLVEDANVKITDISGRLIYETTSYGGQAVWDGHDYNGRRAATGVYLVFSSNRDGLETLVSKLVFVN